MRRAGSSRRSRFAYTFKLRGEVDDMDACGDFLAFVETLVLAEDF